nr:hypothetical protein [Candidatus Cloacimonadota bacterium]
MNNQFDNKQPNPPNKPNKPMFPNMKKSQKITFWIVILLFIVVFYQMSKVNSGKMAQISYTEFIE